MEIHSWKRDPWDEEEVEPLTLHFDTSLPVYVPGTPYLPEQVQAQFRQEARYLVEALYHVLPGGLVDAIYAEFTRRMASVLYVGHRQE